MINFFAEIPRSKHRLLINEDIEQILTKEESERRILILLNGIAVVFSIISLALIIFGHQSKSMIDQKSYKSQKPE